NGSSGGESDGGPALRDRRHPRLCRRARGAARGPPAAPGDTLVCVGDYLDRGPDSRTVIDTVMDLEQRPGVATVFLRGNHEDMCLAYLGRGGHYGESWMLNGGAATLRSYGLDARVSGSE